MLHFHLFTESLTPIFGNHESPWKTGEGRRVEGELRLNHNGYHTSIDPAEWVSLAKDNKAVMALVEISGTVVHESQECLSSEMRVIKAENITHILEKYSEKRELYFLRREIVEALGMNFEEWNKTWIEHRTIEEDAQWD